LFNLGFICVYQHTLIWSLTLPVYLLTVTQGKFVRTGWQDYAVAGLFLAFLVMETVADQQQWNFHQQKKRGASKKGFLTDGLYRYSRHPNFFAEMSLWWTVYLFTLTSSRVGGVQWKQLESLNWRSLINFTAIGPALLVLLFQGSTALTEWISTGKYPEYRTYQRTTSRLIPWFPSSAIAATDGDGKKRAVATAQPRTPRKQQASAAAASATPRRSSPRRAKVD
jgi:steroid 5-alpha reductase family enzyme